MAERRRPPAYLSRPARRDLLDGHGARRIEREQSPQRRLVPAGDGLQLRQRPDPALMALQLVERRWAQARHGPRRSGKGAGRRALKRKPNALAEGDQLGSYLLLARRPPLSTPVGNAAVQPLRECAATVRCDAELRGQSDRPGPIVWVAFRRDFGAPWRRRTQIPGHVEGCSFPSPRSARLTTRRPGSAQRPPSRPLWQGSRPTPP